MMARKTQTSRCVNDGCATGRGASGWPLMAMAAALALVWAVSGNAGWLVLAVLPAAAGAAWLALTWWAGRQKGACDAC